MRWDFFIKKAPIIVLFISLLSTLVFANENEIVMKEVRNTISSQIEAFKENNIKKAIHLRRLIFKLSSPTQMFLV